jgi:hypothetical protein
MQARPTAYCTDLRINLSGPTHWIRASGEQNMRKPASARKNLAIFHYWRIMGQYGWGNQSCVFAVFVSFPAAGFNQRSVDKKPVCPWVPGV